MRRCSEKGLSLSLSLAGILIGSSALAQVIPDDTVNTRVTESGNVSEITGGETRGTNLFHSFREFSVRTGNEALFNNAEAISNIFSRVTGGNISNIDGLIRANGSANLFLLNPAGIIFGEGARLDIGGSFYGSTADSIFFPDGIEFSATDTQAQPVLTINAPIGLNFRDNPQPITNRSITDDMGLQVDTGNNIILVGGDIVFDGGVIFAPGGRVELGGLATEGTVNFNDDLGLNFPEEVPRADISLTNEAQINVRAGSGGSIAINSQNLEILEGSKVRAGIASGSGSPESLAGNIDVDSTETVTISGTNTFISNAVVSGATGNAGDVNITTESLVLRDGGQANSLTQGQGNAGKVNIMASDIFLDGIASDGGSSGFFNTVASGAVGNAGEINIKTASLSITNRAVVNSSTFGQGNAGNIFVQADDSIFMSNDSLIFSTVRNGAIGNGGNITVDSNSLTLLEGAQVQAAVFREENDLAGGQGQGGNIVINSRDFIELSGFSSQSFSSSILTITEQGANGDAGDIIINTGVLRLSDSANVNAATRNSSNGGDITINANTLEAASGGQVRATTRSDGNAGNIILNIIDNITLSGSDPTFFQRRAQFGEDFVSDPGPNSGLFVNPTSNSTGQAGFLILNTGQLNLSEQGTILASTQSSNGGSIVLSVDDTLTLRDNSRISAQAFGEANGGNIDINANFIIAFPKITISLPVLKTELEVI